MNAQITSLNLAAANDAVPNQASLRNLAARWLAAKQAEKYANALRLEIEEQIASRVDNGQVAGTSTAEDGEFKIKVERKLSRKIDTAALIEAVQKMPEAVTDRLLRTKFEISIPELKWLAENDAANYRIATGFITETPAKPAVSVTVPAK